MKKVVLLAFVFVLFSTAVVAGFIRPAVAQGTIYITADGSVEGTDKIQRDGDIYTFTDNIYGSIVVEKDNIVVDGVGYTLQGTGDPASKGIDLTGRSNVTIKNMEIKAFYYGIWLYMSLGNIISGNNIRNNLYGIWLTESSNNTIYHNNFITNTRQVYDYSWDWPAIPPSINIWDDGYSSGGNYWSNYTGVDPDHDGIGNSPHIIDENNQDTYPLMGMFYDFNVAWQEETYHVTTVCNSTVSDFQFNGTAISFDVSGENGTTGFCRICIPTALINGTYKVFVNSTEVPYTLLSSSNSTHNYLYFTYSHSTKEVLIIPELTTWTSMFLMLIVLTVAIAIYKRRRLETLIH